MEDTLQQLHTGSCLWKVRGVSKCYKRNVSVNRGHLCLNVESKKWWSPGGTNSVPLSEVVEIREGWKTDVFNRISNENEKKKKAAGPCFEEDLCFSLVHGAGGLETLDFVASSAEEKTKWVKGLEHFVTVAGSQREHVNHDVWLKSKFKDADKDKSGSLNIDEVCKLITYLNIKMNRKHAKVLFNEANRVSGRRLGGEQVLDAEEFVVFYNSLLKMPEIENLYNKYKNRETEAMGSEELLRFLHDQQHMTELSKNEVNKCIMTYEQSDSKQSGLMTFNGFYQLLLSDFFDIYNHDHRSKVHQDMTQPLAHYYISSSHNTYLIGHQLAGESSVEGYISALKKGCRVVELDVWDGDDGEPIIYHGHTLTSKILLSDVLKDAIKAYAFTASSYPVILSIENHLCIEQQVVMVKQLKTILGDMLLTDPVPKDIKTLPSPHELRNKIIIKAKKPQGSSIEDDDEPDEQEGIDYIDNESSQKAQHHKPMAPELREVVNICEGRKFVSFQSSFEEDKCIHFPSLRENKAKSLLESSAADFIKFTGRQISKIYPLGTRTDSSNLKPYPLWSVGAQVVTLNMQTEDKANFYNDALFKSNGNCGYVLKPNILLNKAPYDPLNPPKSLSRTLQVRVISAQHLPMSDKKGDVIDPYVQLKVRGTPQDQQKQRTSTIKNNGFNPVWNETMTAVIKVPAVSLVYFTVRDESTMAKDPVLAMAAIPFNSLQQGYRHVHLTDISGRSLSPAAVFVHVSIKE